MKKNIKITTTLVLATLTAFLFTSCFDPIYSVIRTDVKPEKATILGHQINTISRYNKGNGEKDNEYLIVAANGGLRYKHAYTQGHGHWKTYTSLPFKLPHNDFENGLEGEEILKVISDKENLYVVTKVFNKGKYDCLKLWCCNKFLTTSQKWLELSKEHNLSISPNSFNVFANNDSVYANRKAYLRINGKSEAENEEDKKDKIYLLKGLNAPSISTERHITEGRINSVANFSGTDYFFNSNAVVSNDKYFYYSDGKKLNYGNPTTPNKGSVTAESSIGALALTKDSILIGCGTDNSTGGIQKAFLNDNKIPGNISAKNFTSNAPFQIPASYQVLYLLNTTPTEPEANSQLYASVTFPGYPAENNKIADRGLWSYYPNRNNWNRE